MRPFHLIGCVLFILLFLAIWNVGQAQDSLGMSCLSALEYWSGAPDIQMVGDLAYVSDCFSGLHIISLADPVHPVDIGRYTWYQESGNCAGIYVAGNRAYVCLPERGIVLDVSDPTHPMTLGQWEGRLSDITYVYDGIAIAESDEGHPYVLDVSDPTNVHQIGDFNDMVGCDALGMVDGYLCMMGYPGGVNVYDMSDPTQPQRVAACDTAFIARFGTLAGNYAYIAGREDGLHIIDLTNPLQPSLIAICGGPSWDVTVTGSHAVVSSEENDSLISGMWLIRLIRYWKAH